MHQKHEDQHKKLTLRLVDVLSFRISSLKLTDLQLFFFTLAKTRWLDSDLFWDFNFNMLTSGEISTEVIENQRHFMNCQYFLVVKSILGVYVSGVSRQKTHPCHSFPPNESIFRHPSGEGQVWQVWGVTRSKKAQSRHRNLWNGTFAPILECLSQSEATKAPKAGPLKTSVQFRGFSPFCGKDQVYQVLSFSKTAPSRAK